MKKLLLVMCVLVLGINAVVSQNVGIGTSTPNASAMLDITSTSKGFLPPRMTFAQIKSISNPTPGLLVYDTEFKCVRIFNGIEWVCLPQIDKSLTDPPGDFVPIHDTTTNTPPGRKITPWGVKADGIGNIYVTGSFTGTVSFDAFTISSTGSGDVFLAKYNNSGSVVWVKTAGSVNDDAGTSIAIDASNNICVAGFYTNASITFGTTTLTNNGLTDIFVTKYDPSGNIIWATGNGGTGNDVMFNIATDAAGNFYTCGFTKSPNFSYGPNIIFGSGTDEGIMLAKYNNAGVVQWARAAGGSANERAFSITTDASGNSYIAGQYESSICSFGGLAILVNSGAVDAFIAAYDAGGNAIWARSSSGTGIEAGMAIGVDNTGTNIYLGGYFTGGSASFSGNTVSNSFPATSNTFLVKYSNAGNVAWAKSAGGPGYDVITSIATNAAGDVYATGFFTPPSIQFDLITLPNAYSVTGTTANDIFIVSYNAAGTVIWAKAGGGLDDDFQSGLQNITTIQQGGFVNIFIIGNYVPSAKFGNNILSSGSYLLWKYKE